MTGGFALEASARREDVAGVQFLAATFERELAACVVSFERACKSVCVCSRAARVFHLAV